MNSRRSRWVSGVGAVLIGGLLVTSAFARDDDRCDDDRGKDKHSCTQILDKLDQILDKLNSSGGGAGNHTLRWDQNNTSATRFTPAFTGAVLDQNTGLVWEQAPDTTGGLNFDGTYPWAKATSYCANKTVPSVGGTVGWRLPSVIELKSVQDPSLSAPFVPTVFDGVQPAGYWSATTGAGTPTQAWYVDFTNGGVVGNGSDQTLAAWCVRGPMQESTY